MYRGTRGIDNVFTADERLFMRCEREWLAEAPPDPGETQVRLCIRPAYIRSTGQSVNRQKYSEFYDVLLPGQTPASARWLYFGVSCLFVSEVPGEIRNAADAAFQFRPEHAPDTDNYGHCELRAFRGQQAAKNVSNTVAKEFRAMLSDRIRVILLPNAGSETPET
jgi:hypothetical protein